MRHDLSTWPIERAEPAIDFPVFRNTLNMFSYVKLATIIL